jgi:ATP-dependent DNA helicase PIF1
MYNTSPPPSPDQAEAIKIIREGKSRYYSIMAPPGCGKSFVVKYLHDNGHRLVRTSTTGVSAINIGGCTINSALGYFDTKDMISKHESNRIYHSLKKYSNQTIVVDEVSMLGASQLEILIRNNEVLWNSTDRGVQFIFVGDFGQLPPVKEAPAFRSELWKGVYPLSLSTVHRTTDMDFISALRLLRVGDCDSATPYLKGIGFYPDIDMDFEGTTLYALNDGADRHNAYCLSKLKGESVYYLPNKVGDPLPEWRNIPDPLELKKGALVLLRSNDWELGYVNGDQGYIIDLDTDSVEVELLRGGRVKVIPTTLEHKTANKRGRITFMPITLAYGITIHKAQSLSIEYLQVVLDDPSTNKNLSFMSRCHGMAFMALSRATTPKHMRVVGDIGTLKDATYCDKSYLPYIT